MPGRVFFLIYLSFVKKKHISLTLKKLYIKEKENTFMEL